MEILLFLGGVAVGCAITSILFYIRLRRNNDGYFVLNPIVDPEDPETFTLGVKITSNVVDKDRIVLVKESQQ